jgi:capsular exopolysaccharide synthesis family protein
MDLRDYLRAVRKRWWLVLGAAAVAVGVAVTVTLLTPPKYAASLTFFVSTRGAEVTQAFQGGQFAQQRVKSYVDVLTSNRLTEAVAASGPIGLDPETVQKEITAQVPLDTVLIVVTVTDPDRARALQIAQSVAAHFPLLIGRIETPPGSRVPTVGVQVIAEPRLADDPVSPQPLRNIGLAVILGLIAGIGAAVLRESLDTTIRSPESLTTAASAPTLSAIPFDSKADASPLITEGSAQSSRAEAMRQLRTNLQFVDVDRPLHSLVVTSALPGEGKSTTVCNLGIAFAEAGKRVIIVDADLRRPMIAEYLGLEGAVGLTNVLAGQASLRDVIQPWGNNSLWVLPSGYIPPNPSELLGSDNMADLLSALSSGFDMIIIDTPPLLPVTDAAVMAAAADGCLLVSRHGKTTTAQVATATSALDAVGAKLHGCVLNLIPARRATVYSYHSYESLPLANGDAKNSKESRTAPAPTAPTWPIASHQRQPNVVATGRAKPITGQPGWPEDFDAPTTGLRLPPTYQSDSALTTDLRELR